MDVWYHGTVLIIFFSWLSQKGPSHGMNIL